MASQLEKTIQETFSDPNSLSPEKIQALIQEALKTFISLKNKSQSKDPKEREEAYKLALYLKEVIQAQTEELVKRSGIDLAALTAIAENRDLFAPDTWIELSSAKKELEAFQDQLGIQSKKTSKKPKTPRIMG